MASDIRWLRVETPSVPTHANMYGMEQELFDKSFLPQVLMRLHSHQVAIASQFLQTLQQPQLLWPRTLATNRGNQARKQRAQEQHGAQVGFYGTTFKPPRRRRTRRLLCASPRAPVVRDSSAPRQRACIRSSLGPCHVGLYA